MYRRKPPGGVVDISIKQIFETPTGGEQGRT